MGFQKLGQGIAQLGRGTHQGLMATTKITGQLAQNTISNLKNKIKTALIWPAKPGEQLVQEQNVEELKQEAEAVPTLVPKNLPPDMVLVKSRRGNLDLAWAGQVKLTAGMNFYSFIRPSVKPKRVVGRLFFNQALSQEEFNKIFNGQDNNDWHLINEASAAASAQAMDWQVAEVEYQDLGENNIYMADVTVPQIAGNYTFETEVELPEGGSRLFSLTAEVEKRGYVYEQMERGIEGRLDRVEVMLERYNNQTGQFDLWPAEQYDQTNPQTTSKEGEYFFLVPPGIYRLSAKKAGYEDYLSQEMVINRSQPIVEAIKMKYLDRSWSEKFKDALGF